MAQTAKHIVFTGHVQGVGFRFTTHNIAGRYDVTGFVRNCPDGTVEMRIQGPAQEVDDCLENIQDSFAGYIREMRIEEARFDPKYTDFGITF